MKIPLSLFYFLFSLSFSKSGEADPSKETFDNCVSQECSTLGYTDNLKCLQYCLLKMKNQNEESQKIPILKHINEISNLPENYCLNSKAPNELNSVELLLEFAKGPCSPLMLVPGILATKLIVEIDCEELKTNEPDTFSLCGWNTCDSTDKTPLKEYTLWIPKIMTPLSIFSIHEKSNLCFTNLFKPNFDLTQDVENLISPKKGIKIKIFGFSEETKSVNDCGDESIRNLLPLPMQTTDSGGFANLISSLQRIGYKPGLTYQSMPYNFLYSYKKNEFRLNFEKNLQRLRTLTGKKVTIVAHSMGNLNVLYSLNKLTLEFLQGHVYNYLAIGPPYLGVIKANRFILSGDDEFSSFEGRLGFHFKASADLSTNQLALYELTIVDGFNLYKSEPWLENVVKRIKYENDPVNIGFSNSGIPFWPSLDLQCHENSIKNIIPNCNIGISDAKKPIFQFGDEEYKISDIERLNEKYKLRPEAEILYKKLHDESLAMMTPRVPTAIIFSNSIETPNLYDYKNNFLEKISSDLFPTVETKSFAPGDRTVPTISAILPGLRWAFQYEARSNNSFPVKFVEYCSILENDEKIYENNQISKNGYMGIKCRCLDSSEENYKNCRHSYMHADPNVIKFIYEFLNAKQIVSNEDLTSISQIDLNALDSEVINCTHITPNIF